MAVYNGFKIKKMAGSEDESLAQLVIFLAYLLRNVKDLKRRAQGKRENTLVREGRSESAIPLDDRSKVDKIYVHSIWHSVSC